jgi:hypothetical protein
MNMDSYDDEAALVVPLSIAAAEVFSAAIYRETDE